MRATGGHHSQPLLWWPVEYTCLTMDLSEGKMNNNYNDLSTRRILTKHAYTEVQSGNFSYGSMLITDMTTMCTAQKQMLVIHRGDQYMYPLQQFIEKIRTDSHKTDKFVKVLSLEEFTIIV